MGATFTQYNPNDYGDNLKLHDLNARSSRFYIGVLDKLKTVGNYLVEDYHIAQQLRA